MQISLGLMELLGASPQGGEEGLVSNSPQAPASPADMANSPDQDAFADKLQQIVAGQQQVGAAGKKPAPLVNGANRSAGHNHSGASLDYRKPEWIKLGKILKNEDLIAASPALSLLTGDYSGLQPKELPKLISGDPLIAKAFADNDIGQFMSERRPAHVQLDLLQLSNAIRGKLKSAGIDLSQPISLSGLLRVAGVDPGKVVAQLHRIKDSVMDGGVGKLMAQAAAARKGGAPNHSGVADPRAAMQAADVAKHPVADARSGKLKVDTPAMHSTPSRISSLGGTVNQSSHSAMPNLASELGGSNTLPVKSPTLAASTQGQAGVIPNAKSMSSSQERSPAGRLSGVSATTSLKTVFARPTESAQVLNADGRELRRILELEMQGDRGSDARLQDVSQAKDDHLSHLSQSSSAKWRSSYAQNIAESASARLSPGADGRDSALIASHRYDEAVSSRLLPESAWVQESLEDGDMNANAFSGMSGLEKASLESSVPNMPRREASVASAFPTSSDLAGPNRVAAAHAAHRPHNPRVSPSSHRSGRSMASVRELTMPEAPKSQTSGFMEPGLDAVEEPGLEKFQTVSDGLKKLAEAEQSDGPSIEDRIVQHTEFLVRQGGGQAALHFSHGDGDASVIVSLQGEDVKIRLTSDQDALIDAFSDGLSGLDEALAKHDLLLTQVEVGDSSEAPSRRFADSQSFHRDGLHEFAQERFQEGNRRHMESLNQNPVKSGVPEIVSRSLNSANIQVLA